MFEKMKFKLGHNRELVGIKKREKAELADLDRKNKAEVIVVSDKEEYEKEIKRLDRELELEKKRAELRKFKAKNFDKTQPENKSSWDKFRDYATKFSNQSSIVGDMNFNLGGQDGKTKKGSKRSRTRIRSSSYRI